MKRSLLLAAVIMTAWPAAAALAQNPPSKPDLAKAQGIVKEVCSACHGPDGNSATPVDPSLAGMPASISPCNSMHFKAGVRVNPVMQGMAATLSPDDMRMLGILFCRQKPKGLAAKDASLLTEGQIALSRRRCRRGYSGVRGLPFARRLRRAEELPPPRGPVSEYTYAS